MGNRYRTPYHEDDDLASPAAYRPQSQSGSYSAIATLISFGLLLVIAVLGVMANQVGNSETSGLMIIAILFLDLVAFAASLFGLILGIRSQSAENDYHRGYGLAGLIGGIVCLLAAIAVGLVSMCIGTFLALVQNVPGG
jgi:hypothetical protein